MRYNLDFWKAAADRAIRSVAQALVLLWPVADGMFNALTVNWALAAGVALGAAILSILNSVLLPGAVSPTPASSKPVR